MKLDNIGFYTLSDYRVKGTNAFSPLQRCELLITSKCNFKCSYCRGTDDSADISFEQARKIVGIWADGCLRNIRFSGGEPTIVPWLVDIVRYAKNNYIKRIAISTNGSAERDLYDELLYIGVNDFSISLDACCSSTGDMMAGRKGVYKKVIDNIKYLSSKTYVTVGVVLTETNINDLKDIIDFASNELNVSDIRIITAAQYNKKISDLDISDAILRKHPILKYRIDNIRNNKDIRGIKKCDNNKCPLLLDDMAVKGNHHYPCIIKMREGCDPIGEMTTLTEIRLKRREYFLKTNTYNDEICKKNCLDVCVDYNNKVKEFKDECFNKFAI